MKNIEIKIFKETRMVELNKFIIGNDGENLQGNLVFTFDEFVDGQARLEYVIDGKKNYIVLEKVGETYQVPILSVITKKGQIDMQVVVTQGTEDVAIFKSNLFYLTCNASINAEIEQPDEYLQWIEVANAKLNEVDNLDIDAVKENGVATITITKKDGTQQSVNLFDAEGAVTNYELLENLPSIGGVELVGDKTLEELGIQEKGNYLTSENDPLFKQSASYGITSQDIKNWNNKSEFSGNYDDLNGKPKIPTKTSELINDSGFIDEPQDISGKQDKLISGETIKTINNQSLLGSGNITITSESGTSDYNALENRPKINNITLSGNKTLDELGIQKKGEYLTKIPSEYVTESELEEKGYLTEHQSLDHLQEKLKSGENIKTINGNSLLGSGNIEIQGVGGTGADDVPINTIVEYDGTEVPDGWEEVKENNNVLSNIVNSIVVVDALPEVEIEGVLYLVKESEIIEPELINLYPNQVEHTEEDGFAITFKEQNVIVNGSNNSSSVWGWTNKFTMNLEANKTYYLQLTNISGSFDDSKRVSESDGVVTTVSLSAYNSAGTETQLISQVERPANGIYEKYTFTPTIEYAQYSVSLQVKKYNSFNNWTCSIVIAEEK